MSVVEKVWKIAEKADARQVKQLVDSVSVREPIANLLAQRGITSYEEAKTFFNPSLDNLHDPFLMKDMQLAIDRIKQAISRNEKILVYGDYDVDGTTAVSLVYRFLKDDFFPCQHFQGKIDFYIPDREKEGYGISEESIDYVIAQGYTLIIALDCGIKAVDKIARAGREGIDYIVCDHHLPGEVLPPAFAILDPKQADCAYPNKELSGCGVGFKFMQALAISYQMPDDQLFHYLDLLVVSIASDVVSIVGENRILAYYGLKKLNESPSVGLRALIRAAGIEGKELHIEDIVFRIGPRINAAGRVKSANTTVELMVSKDAEQAKAIAADINCLNDERKMLDCDITTEALLMIATEEGQAARKSNVVYKEAWHKGVIGIVASRLIEHYYKPTVVLAKSNGLVTGSARSVEGFDLYQAIDSCGHLLERYGGHKFAAGLSLKAENIPLFREAFEKAVDETITREMMTPHIHIDEELKMEDISPKFFRIIKRFAPFGPDNMTPVFCTRNLCDRNAVKIVGSTREHLRLQLKNEALPKGIINGIAFGLARYYEDIRAGKSFDLCYVLSENDYMGVKSMQMQIRDIRVHDESVMQS